MAAPSYTTDLVDIIAEMPNTTGWTLISTGGGGANSLQAPETDYFIQGNNCISRNPFSTSTRGMVYDFGSDVTISSGNAIFYWVWAGVPNAIATESNGGIQGLVGSGTGALGAYYLRGSDTYQYGGWICIPVDPNETQDATIGTPAGNRRFFGVRWNVPATGPARGNPFAIDAIRHGRTLQVVNGEINNYATFIGAATQNDSQSNRWGLFQSIDGAFLSQGLFLMGTASTPVDFRDSNRVIVIANTKKVGVNFNTFEVRNASSRVDWINISIQALGTQSRGRFIATNNANINIEGCVFTDMGSFTFLSNSSILGTVFRRCDLVTQNSSEIINSTFDRSTSPSSILSNNPANIAGCSFTRATTGHAIEISTPGTYSFLNNSFIGYATSDGSTGNEVIYNNSGGHVVLNVSGGSGFISVRNGAGSTTDVIVGLTNITLTGLKPDTEVRIYEDDSGVNGDEIAGIEDSGTTFTFSATASSIINIIINNLNYLPADIWGLEVPSEDTTIPISQFRDRQYFNPT